MKKLIALFLCFVLLSIQTCFAIEGEQQKEIVVRVCETVTSESITTADTIMAELVTGFTLKNGSSFKKGAIVELLPKEIKKRGFAGRGGYIEIRKGLIKDTKGKEYTVSLRQKIQGDDKDWVIACLAFFTATIILIPLDLFVGFIKGGSAKLEEGSTVECYINY